MSKKISIILILCVLASVSFAQIHLFDYKQNLHNVELGWNKLVIPAHIFEKIQTNYSDVRIYGINYKGDTVEAPYFPMISQEIRESNQLRIETFNHSNNHHGHFYSFKMPPSYRLTTIELEVEQDNFDWHIQLEGSHDQKSWFTIVNNTRMVGVKNNFTNYKFTRIELPVAQYTYYRIHETNGEFPIISSVIIPESISKPAVWVDYPILKYTSAKTYIKGETQLEIELEHKVPLSWLFVDVTDTFDYYRPIEILYQTGESKTESKFKPIYGFLTSGTLSSFEKGTFLFEETMVNKLRIVVQNYDNRPLQLSKVSARGYQHSIAFRINESADYFLVYGGNELRLPNYDVGRFFTGNEHLNSVQLDHIQIIEHQPPQIIKPLFKHKFWLWIIMGMIIILLGWFTIAIIKKA